jgi:hypothetical protein
MQEEIIQISIENLFSIRILRNLSPQRKDKVFQFSNLLIRNKVNHVFTPRN